MNTESVIQVADLRVDYGARTAVAGIRPDVRPGASVPAARLGLPVLTR